MATKIDYIVFIAFLKEIINDDELSCEKKIKMIKSALDKIEINAETKSNAVKK